MAENMFNWQFNTIPGLANQGAILMTKNDITEPPFQQSDFIWKAMEDVIGVANVKFEYDEVNNKYHIYKAKGHQNNQGQWSYSWEEYGTWDALPEEVVETLRAMTYIQYRFVTQNVLGNTVLTIYGVRKTGVEDVIAIITFTSKTYVDNTIEALRQNLMVYINKKWEYNGQVSTKTNLPSSASFGNVYLVEDESDLYINISETSTPSWKPFTQIAENFTVYAIELQKGSNGLYAQLRYDSIDFLIDNAQNLKAQIIDDTLDASSPLANRKTYSIDKILQILSSSMRYKGQVNYYDLLPTTGNVAGDTWNVKYSGTSSQGGTDLDGDNYCWSGTSWDNLSGEYRAGVGIQIEGKVISATGISFNVGSGIKITGSGSNAVLETRNGDGLEYQNVGTTANPIYANAVKPHNGITVDSNGVSIDVDDSTVKFDNNSKVAVKLDPQSEFVVNSRGIALPDSLIPVKEHIKCYEVPVGAYGYNNPNEVRIAVPSRSTGRTVTVNSFKLRGFCTSTGGIEYLRLSDGTNDVWSKGDLVALGFGITAYQRNYTNTSIVISITPPSGITFTNAGSLLSAMISCDINIS